MFKIQKSEKDFLSMLPSANMCIAMMVNELQQADAWQ